MIKCLICNREFNKQINNRHLKSHDITASEYKARYSVTSLLCPQYKQELSARRSGCLNANWGKEWTPQQRADAGMKLKGRVPWNKGVQIGSGTAHAQGIAQREERYKNGELTRTTREWTHQQRDQHSEVMKEWNGSRSNEQKTASAYRAVETKRTRGEDLAFFRGRQHTSETKSQLSELSRRANNEKSQRAHEARLALIESAGLEYRGNGSGQSILLRCRQCMSEFALTKQCFTHSKARTDWCNTCYPPKPQWRSQAECELYDWVSAISGDATHSNRQLLPNRGEIDIWLPSHKIAIEYNGLYWHSASQLAKTGKEPTADYQKYRLLQSMGIRYIGIFEDEWQHNQAICKSRLLQLLDATPHKIGARKCKVVEVSSKDAAQFCRDNHISGGGRSNARYGLTYNGQLVSVMTFSRSNISRKVQGWEINRFCSVLNTTIVGGASRLWRRFLEDHQPDSVVTYADSRWSCGDLYKTLGFEFVGHTVPNYWYVPAGRTTRIHRYTLRKGAGETFTGSERAYRESQGYGVIYDCGSTKWQWTKK